MSVKGMAYIVGAGPGDPELISLKGRDAIAKAEVILYDYLSPKELLSHAPDSCEIIYVGKKAGKHTMPQEEINELLCEKAKHKVVVRLKGGDPFVFGRGAEEMLALKESKIPYEVIPGITASVAAPAYAGIPVTHRDLTQTFTLVTGHEAPGKDEEGVPWEALGKLGGTIAFYMGVKNIRANLDKLIKGGLDKNTPVAFIRWGTTPQQRVFTGTASDIESRIPEDLRKPPAMILVGAVASMRDKLKWFEDKPLFGRTVLVTRSRKQASSAVKSLRSLGASCIELPTIRIEPPHSFEGLDKSVNDISGFDWIVFTSVNGVDNFISRLLNAGLDSRALFGKKIGSIGPATTARLKEHGLVADFQPAKYESAAIVKELKEKFKLKGKKILLPRADIAPPALAESLSDLGADVHNVTAYRTLKIEDKREDIRRMIEEGIDCMMFSSSSTVQNFFDWYGSDEFKKLKKKPVIASIGPITTATIEENGFKPEIISRQATIPSMIEGIASYFLKGGKV